MKCTISGQKLIIFQRAIQFLSRVGDEIHFESFLRGLSISTVNSKKTAFGSVKFDLEFFREYEANVDPENPESQQCKVSIKSILPLFRSLKQVELGKIELDARHCRLNFQFTSRLKVTKRHSVPILEYSRIGELSVSEQFSNRICSPYKLMENILSSFTSTTREICFEVTPSSIEIKNYIDNPEFDSKSVRSKYKLRTDEFDLFSIEEETSVAFSFSDFRAFTHFAASNEINLNINFDSPGQPMYLNCRDIERFHARLIVATIVIDAENTIHNRSVPQGQQNISSCTSDASKGSGHKRQQHKSKTKQKRVVNVHESEDPFNFVDNILQPDQARPSVSNNPSVANIPVESLPEARSTIASPNITEQNNLSVLKAAFGNNNLRSEVNQKNSHLDQSTSKRSIMEPIIPLENLDQRTSEEIVFETEETPNSSDSDENIPPSPRTTFFRRIFRKCFEDTFDPRTIPGASQILAEKTDDEDEEMT